MIYIFTKIDSTTQRDVLTLLRMGLFEAAHEKLERNKQKYKLTYYLALKTIIFPYLNSEVLLT